MDCLERFDPTRLFEGDCMPMEMLGLVTRAGRLIGAVNTQTNLVAVIQQRLQELPSAVMRRDNFGISLKGRRITADQKNSAHWVKSDTGANPRISVVPALQSVIGFRPCFLKITRLVWRLTCSSRSGQ
jgi:hypothetical protein